MNAEMLWAEFCRERNLDSGTPYEAWAFGSAPDELAELVLQGIKTATASGYELYFAEGEAEPMPTVGEYSVILNSRDEALCVIRTTRVTVIPYVQVGSDQAYKEGEGDRSLAYWRRVHEAFFEAEYQSCGLVFTPESKIVCEEFELLYVPSGR